MAGVLSGKFSCPGLLCVICILLVLGAFFFWDKVPDKSKLVVILSHSFESPVHQHREVMAVALQAALLTAFLYRVRPYHGLVPPASAGVTPWKTRPEAYFCASSKSCQGDSAEYGSAAFECV